jgi:hypothetical protein
MSSITAPDIVVRVLQNAIDSGREHLQALNNAYAQAKADVSFQKTGIQIFEQQLKLDLTDEMRGHIEQVFGNCVAEHAEAVDRVRSLMEKIEAMGSELSQLTVFADRVTPPDVAPCDVTVAEDCECDGQMVLPLVPNPVGPN